MRNRELMEGLKVNSTAVADFLHLDDSLQILLLVVENGGVEASEQKKRGSYK